MAWLAFVGVSVSAVAGACGSENSLVDGECATGYQTCVGTCIDVNSNRDHCGACGAPCAPGVACNAGACGGWLDGAPYSDPDADGSLDGRDHPDGRGGGHGDDDASDACPPPPYLTAEACGACGVVCAAPNSVCRVENGAPSCAPPCAAPFAECNGRCVDFHVNDARNCGACGKTCPSNICVAGKCQGATPGDLIVIGHDYKEGFAGSSQAKVLTNAVFLPTTNPLRILSFESFADAVNVSNVKNLIQNAPVGRTVKFDVAANSGALVSPTLSDAYDVVLLHDQQGASAATLAGIGATWAVSLEAFGRAGGIIVALDGAGGQGGMPALLTAANLLNVSGHQALASGELVSIVAPTDRISTFVVSPYSAFDRSVTFQVNEANGPNLVFVADHLVNGIPTAPVVIHKVIP
jgi:hypothetical protein